MAAYSLGLKPGILSLSAKDAVSDSRLSATWEVYKEFPTEIDGCKEDASCGVVAIDASGNAAVGTMILSGSQLVELPVSSYLVVVSYTGYYTVYFQVGLNQGITETVSAQMAQALEQNQDRVVMRWASGDVDLWVYCLNSAGALVSSVGYYSKQQIVGGGVITLDRDGGRGGSETTQFKNMAKGVYEVWIHSYGSRGGAFSRESVANDPTTLDVYCSSCHDAMGNTRTGSVTSVTQVASDLPSDGQYKWMKMGTFISPSPQGGGVTSQWTSCVPSVETCYKSVNQI